MPYPLDTQAPRTVQPGALRRGARTLLAGLLVVGLTAPALAQRPDRDDDRRGPDRSNDERGDRGHRDHADQPADEARRAEQSRHAEQAEQERRAERQGRAERADQDRRAEQDQRAAEQRRGEQQRRAELADQQRRAEMQRQAETRDDRDHRDDRRDDHRDERRDDRREDRRDWDRRDDRFERNRGDWRPNGGWHRDRNVVIYRGRPVIVRPERRRVYRDIVVLRPYGHYYYGYGRYYRDDDAWRFLGLSAITFAILDAMSEAQQRALEDAQIRATETPVGEPIYWEERGAEGMVVATREGHTRDGRYCREFQQEVTIGGRREEAYGTACQQPDGSWQVVDD